MATIEQQLIDKMGKREFGRLMDRIARITVKEGDKKNG